ncbi:MAG: 1-deoxy-D-xylulose-5-phosphate reductoisomerase [Giesbergeria sp.]|jgi:1-deoxy-D-xylulose-5-phosphate reductoisomerase|nr:1-deoxy-D-xylulose-5-phosphate reductoisomerase [Giesbergeria sp.]MBP6158832.1 1-deoxy-D-xylulose-5-phosphate reductoisomerase [Giesbergeria sp.]MBP7082353.1 1-deoxy-D-xylulose-5-phosphate reductoisomerase [Giesbergeria sp.]MBP9783082.1 1-deoxy-D-xylulose-5-phosphate reductoisomerase [Giesbergeria sp.]MBP9893965.1 1-deoxy-D-xylulose-5-phosphate reductoisomerase [Giesbergeria sp.]
MRQRVTVLGSTGSIGKNTLDVIARHPERFEVFALSASTQTDLLLAQCAQFRPRYAVMASAPHARDLAEKIQSNGLPTQVLQSQDALEIIASHAEVDSVMAAIVGAAGLAPCLAAAHAGKRLLLANKEALVVGGEVFLRAVRDGHATLLPIDSEHSAIFQSLPDDPATWGERVDKIILTASGGPFRSRAPASLRDVTPADACAHPNWVMGRKISVDSATMMNKALEVIEARYLFGLAPEQLDVVIHPQSTIHSMVQYRDMSVVAQMGTPDMRVPIAYGLSWPERVASGAAALDFHALGAMTFESIDDHGHPERFPSLRLAWETLAAPPGTTVVLNAANEVAVAAFLERRIRFDQIHALNVETLTTVPSSKPDSLAALLELDARARSSAQQHAARMAA